MEQSKCNIEESVEEMKKLPYKSLLAEFWKPLLSFVLMVSGILMKASKSPFFEQPYVALAWYVLAYLPVGLPVMKEALESILDKDYFSEFTLMTIATLGAFYIGEYPEGVAVMLFYCVGEIFQDRAVDRAKRNIGDLLDTRPETANVVRGEELVVEDPRQVKVGDTIEIRAGERIPLDGRLVTDAASFDTSALTGESIPRTIRRGGEVLAGMLASDKVIRIEVTKPFDKSALARILDLVQNAAERKAPAELFIRKFARIYTPIVIGLAFMVVLVPWFWSLANANVLFDFNTWLYRALVLLVISCPCALVISIPLGYFGGIGAASRLGILFKGGNYLDAITKVNTVVFDKTGTLTRGTFDVQTVAPAEKIPSDELVQLVASVETNSTHPIAKAVVRYAERQKIGLRKTTEVNEISGHGLTAEIDGKKILAGNLRLLDKFGVKYPEAIRKVRETIVVCAVDGQYAGFLSLSDELKPDAAATIVGLKKLGIENIQILSGDKQSIVTIFAEKLGVEQAYGDLLPEGKVKHIEELKRNPANNVAFVGDGMNDAPVLALSDVGIAMGGLGSDAAIETADIVIQTDQPSKVPVAVRVGRTTRRIVWQNVGLALGVKLVVMVLGTMGLANLWEAVFADVGVALLAILNSVRIQHILK